MAESKIWDEIKNVDLQCFSLPNQTFARVSELLGDSTDEKANIFVGNLQIVHFVESYFEKHPKYVIAKKRQLLHNRNSGMSIDIVSKDSLNKAKTIPHVIHASEPLASTIWDEIKVIDLEMYSMKGQILAKYAELVPDFTKDRATLFIKNVTIAPQIENILGAIKKFTVDNRREFFYNQQPGVAIDISLKQPVSAVTIDERGNCGKDIWEDIRRVDIRAFSMLNQFVEKFFQPIFTNDEDTLFLFTTQQFQIQNLVNAVFMKYDISDTKPHVHNKQNGYLLRVYKK